MSSSSSKAHERRLLIAAIFFIAIAIGAAVLTFQSKALNNPGAGNEKKARRSDVAYLSEAVRSAMSAPTGCLPNTASYEHCLSLTQQHREYLVNAERTFTQFMSNISQNMGCFYWDQASQLNPRSSTAQREAALIETYTLIRQLEQLASSDNKQRDPVFLTTANIHESFDQLFRPQASGRAVNFSAFEGDLGHRRAAEFSQYLLGQCQKLLDENKCSRNCFNTNH